MNAVAETITEQTRRREAGTLGLLLSQDEPDDFVGCSISDGRLDSKRMQGGLRSHPSIISRYCAAMSFVFKARRRAHSQTYPPNQPLSAPCLCVHNEKPRASLRMECDRISVYSCAHQREQGAHNHTQSGYIVVQSRDKACMVWIYSIRGAACNAVVAGSISTSAATISFFSL